VLRSSRKADVLVLSLEHLALIELHGATLKPKTERIDLGTRVPWTSANSGSVLISSSKNGDSQHTHPA
jgi:hypothetical protein